MKRAVALFSWLALAGPLWADLKITGETKVEPYRLVRLTAEGATADSAVVWDVDEEKLDAEEIGNRLLFTGPAGTYRVKCRAIRLKDGKPLIETARTTVTIGTPGPKPPDPPVPPGPEPTPGTGKRVLIVYETSEATKLPEEQKQILYSRIPRDFLNSKCEADSDGKTKAWRIWDFDTAVDAESKLWQDAMKRKPPRDKLPWILITDSAGKPVHEGPLPANVTEALALFRKHLGG